MTRNGTRRGFTLIELLVVVSIVVLLVSILLPAVGQVRTQARVSVCTQNLKQHGVGVANFATNNDDTLPHAPKAPAAGGTTPGSRPYGLPGRPARRFANDDFPYNGFRFAGGETGGVYSLFACGNAELRPGGPTWFELTMTTGYWTVMSEYMTDGEGMGALTEGVFTSPSDRTGEASITAAREDIEDADGEWFELDSDGREYPLLSYRYVSAGLVTDRVFTYELGTTGRTLPFPNILIGTEDVLDSEEQFYQVVRRRASSQVQFPSNKVLFYMWNAWHNPDLDIWFQPGAIIPVALADGSARQTIPYNDGLYDTESNYGDPNDNAGPIFTYRFGGGDVSLSTSIERFPAHYFGTLGGLAGRDL